MCICIKLNLASISFIGISSMTLWSPTTFVSLAVERVKSNDLQRAFQQRCSCVWILPIFWDYFLTESRTIRQRWDIFIASNAINWFPLILKANKVSVVVDSSNDLGATTLASTECDTQTVIFITRQNVSTCGLYSPISGIAVNHSGAPCNWKPKVYLEYRMRDIRSVHPLQGSLMQALPAMQLKQKSPQNQLSTNIIHRKCPIVLHANQTYNLWFEKFWCFLSMRLRTDSFYIFLCSPEKFLCVNRCGWDHQYNFELTLTIYP